MADTLVHTFFATAARKGDAIAMRTRTSSGWSDITWADYARDARRVGKALMAQGVGPGGAVALSGANRAEWVVAAVGAMCVGAAPAGLYPTSTAEQAAYVLRHARARVALVDDGAQEHKLASQRASLPELRRVVRTDTGWEAFLASGDEVPDEAFARRLAAVRGADLATLIYTSGTTGAPKAVRLTHDNVAFTLRTYADALGLHGGDDDLVSYLPLSHVAEQNLTLFGPLLHGTRVWFCPRLELLGEVLREARPTLFFAVPRVWERLEGKLREAGAEAPLLARRIGAWARSVGARAARARLEGGRRPRSYPLADRLLLRRIKERLGLDRAKLLVSGAAKIRRETLEYFLSLDLPICEVYGMSEGCALATLNLPGRARLGTVGRPLPGVELRLADDGEILLRGPHVFAGYLRDEAATREAVDADGWLRTGDVGALDPDGFLRITDRKKDLFKTSGGQYVAPAHVEGLLGTIDGVGQAVVIGEGRGTCVALLALDPEAAPRVAERLGARARELPSLAGDPVFLRHVAERVEAVNGRLARHATVRRFHVLPAPFSIETGELTPTLKLKRRVVEARHEALIERMYREIEGGAGG